VAGLSPDTGLVLRRRVQRKPGAVHVTVRDHVFRVSAGVFWQVHVGAAAALLDAVLDAASPRPGEHVVDLYAGAGLFSVPLAAAVGPEGSVVAVERDQTACADARHNGSSHPALRVQEAAVTPELVATQIGTPHVIVLDPARQGAGTAVTRALAERHAATARLLVYVACDPASFARDAGVLTGEGWQLDGLRAFDIFPMTEHVELVAAFTPPA
jgi:tRNA/tmRNA/rRNA uracil-C5-methylase (TrmA/RlmC/RlmD family)